MSMSGAAVNTYLNGISNDQGPKITGKGSLQATDVEVDAKRRSIFDNDANSDSYDELW